MEDWVQPLLTLQDKDLRIRRIEEQIRAAPVQKQETAALLKAAEEKVASAQQHVIETEKSIKTTEMSIESTQQRLNEFRSKTAMIKNNDEYRAALAQIQELEAEISRLEDQELELLEELDKARQDLNKAKTEAEQTKTRVDDMLEDLDARVKNFTAMLEQLRNERSQDAAAVPAEVLRTYERLRKSPAFASRPIVVPLRDGVCEGCHMQATAQMRMDVSKGKFVTCQYCNAILYSED